jgi:amino acid transporter
MAFLATAASDQMLVAFSVVVLVLGYAAVFALWFFVFRKPTEDEKNRPPR